MKACQACYAINQDDAAYCVECQGSMNPAAAPAKPKTYRTDALGIIFYQCVDVDEHGQRCANRGTISMGTLSTGPSGKEPPDPRYCYLHFPPFKGRYHNAKNVPPPQGFAALKAIVDKVIPRKPREPGEEG